MSSLTKGRAAWDVRGTTSAATNQAPTTRAARNRRAQGMGGLLAKGQSAPSWLRDCARWASARCTWCRLVEGSRVTLASAATLRLGTRECNGNPHDQVARR